MLCRLPVEDFEQHSDLTAQVMRVWDRALSCLMQHRLSQAPPQAQVQP